MVCQHRGTLTEEYLRLLVVQSALLGPGVGGDDELGRRGWTGGRHSHDQHGAPVEPLLAADLGGELVLRVVAEFSPCCLATLQTAPCTGRNPMSSQLGRTSET